MTDAMNRRIHGHRVDAALLGMAAVASFAWGSTISMVMGAEIIPHPVAGLMATFSGLFGALAAMRDVPAGERIP